MSQKDTLDPGTLTPNDVPSPNGVLVSSGCRYYGMSRKTVDGGINTLGLYRRTDDQQVPYKVYLVTPKTAFRPDLISYTAYGVTDYWWYILEFNKLKGIEEVIPDRTLRIPENVGTLFRTTQDNDPIFA